jgi:hypothetical protein
MPAAAWLRTTDGSAGIGCSASGRIGQRSLRRKGVPAALVGNSADVPYTRNLADVVYWRPHQSV